MSGCTVQRLEAPGLTFLKVSGTIDESFSAPQLSQQIRADTILHLGKVGRFSSFGVREWVRLMKDLQGRVKHCILVECSPAVVNQLNMVVDFAAGAHVKSVQLPYACQMCELDKYVTVDVDAQRQELLQGNLPLVPCPQCQNPMVFDDIPSSYLAFLRDAAPAAPGSPMAAFIASFEQAAPKLDALESGGPGLVAPPMPSGPAPAAEAPAAAAPARGMPPAVKYAAAAAVLLVVGGVAWTTMRPAPPPEPTKSQVAVQAPPKPTGPRSMSSEESLELGTLLNAERFDKAEAFIAAHEKDWLEESTNKAKAQVQGARSDAVERHITKARVLIPDGRLQEARDELSRAIESGGESEQSAVVRLQLERRAADCPAVLAAHDALLAGYPESSFLKEAAAAKKACMVVPAIPAREMKRALDMLKADIETCLKAPAEGASSIDLAWTVAPNGAATQVSCLTPALAKSQMCDCLSEQVRRLRFSERVGGQLRRGQYTFTPTPG